MSANQISIKLGLESDAYDKGIRAVQEETKSAFDALKVKYTESGKAMATALESVGNVQGFIALQDKTDKAGKSFESAQAKLDVLQAKLKVLPVDTDKGAEAFDVLTAQIKAQELAVAKSAEAHQKLQSKLQAAGEKLKSAGVDTAKLADEEKRLADAAKLAQMQHGNLADQMTSLKSKSADLASQQAKTKASYELLNIRPFATIRADIDATKAAYVSLRDSGKLTSSELAQAADHARQRIEALKHETNGWKDSMVRARGEIAQFVAAAAGIAIATREAIRFETAMADVSKVVDFNTPNGFVKLTADIKALSREIPLTAVELAGLAAAGGSMGIAADKLRDFVAIGAKLSTAFGIPAEKAGESLGKLMNIFGMSVPQIALLGDAMNQLGNKMAATEKDILEVTMRAGGTAKTFGLAAEQTSALAAAFLSLGRAPEVAGTAINALLVKLQTAKTGSKDFQDGLSALGLSADKLAADISARPQQALSGFLSTLKELDNQSRAEILSKMFGQEYSDDLNLLINGLDGYKQALGYVAEQANYAGSAQQEFDKRIQTTASQLILTKSAATEAAINLGTVFLPAVKAVAEVVRDTAKALADLAQSYPTLSGLAAAGVTLAVGFAGLRAAALALNMVLGGVFTPLLTNAPITVAAIRTVSGALSMLAAATAAFAVGFSIGTYLRNEFEVARNAGTLMVSSLLKGWELIKFGFESAILSLQHPLDSMLVGVQKTWGELAKTISAGLHAIGADWAASQYDKLAVSLEKASQKTSEYNQKQAALTTGYVAAKAAIDDWAVSEFQANAVTEKSVQTQQQLAQGVSGVTNSVNEATKAMLSQVGSGEQFHASNVKLRGSLMALGLDADAVLTKISSGFTKIKSDFDSVVKNADGNSKAIKAAFEKLLSSAETNQEIDLVKKAFDELKKSGVLSAKEITAEQEKLRGKMVEVEVATDKTTEAFKTLGIESKKALAEKARQSIEALKVVIASGQASVEELGKAFKKAYEQAVASGDGLKKAWLELQAPVYGVTLKTEELTESIKKAGDAGRSSGGAIAAGMREASSAAEAAKAAILGAVAAASRSSATSPWRNQDGTPSTGSSSVSVNLIDKKIKDAIAAQIGGGEVGVNWKMLSDPIGYQALYEQMKAKLEAQAQPGGDSLGRVERHEITVTTPNQRSFQLSASSSADVGALVDALGDYRARLA